MSAQLEIVDAKLGKGAGATRAKETLRTALQTGSIHVCLECAEPALARRSAAAEQQVGGAGPSTHVDAQGGAAEPAVLGRGATQRRSPQRYDPGDVRVQKAA